MAALILAQPPEEEHQVAAFAAEVSQVLRRADDVVGEGGVVGVRDVVEAAADGEAVPAPAEAALEVQIALEPEGQAMAVYGAHHLPVRLLHGKRKTIPRLQSVSDRPIFPGRGEIGPAQEPIGRIPTHAAYVVRNQQRLIHAHVHDGVGESTRTRIAGHPFVPVTEGLARADFRGIIDVAAEIGQGVDSAERRAGVKIRYFRRWGNTRKEHIGIRKAVAPALAQQIHAQLDPARKPLVHLEAPVLVARRIQVMVLNGEHRDGRAAHRRAAGTKFRGDRILIHRAGEELHAGGIVDDRVAARKASVFQSRGGIRKRDAGGDQRMADQLVPILAGTRFQHQVRPHPPGVYHVRGHFGAGPAEHPAAGEGGALEQLAGEPEQLVAGAPEILGISQAVQVHAQLELMPTGQVKRRQEQVGQQLVAARGLNPVHVVIAAVAKGGDLVVVLTLRNLDYYQITPFGHRGNYYVDGVQTSRRDQLLANLFLPSFHLAGGHQLKLGMDLDRLAYSQDFRRTGYELFGLSGELLQRTTFAGSGVLGRPSAEVSSYVVDTWRVRPNLVLEAGARQDWDELIRHTLISPRVSFSYSPAALKNTRFSGGCAVVYDATRVQLFTRPMDQYAVTTEFGPGGAAVGGPAITVFTIQNHHLDAPRYQNWSFEVDQRLPRRIQLGVNLLRKRGSHGFTYANMLLPGVPPPTEVADLYPGAAFGAIYTLANYRRDVYDSAEISARQSFGDRYEWMASYTRSRALSNAVVDMSVDQPLLIADNVGRMSWDTPNRFLSWAYLPTPRKNWAIAYLLEARDGFPFSVQQPDGQVVGAVNSHRLPFWFNLNLHLERRFRWRGYRFAIRGGFNNITDHNNATLANNIIGSPQYLTYFGSEGRHLVFLLRWLGKD